MKKYLFKTDKYKKDRGGYSRLLNLHCLRCNHLICVYQKDGPGNLRRLYMDRIFDPIELTDLEKKSLAKIPNLKCRNCKELLGTPYVYPREKRKAFRLYQDALVKKIRKQK